MNRVIRELASRAETREIGYYFFDREKFAQLIIEECINEIEESKECDPATGNIIECEKNTILTQQTERLKRLLQP